MPNNLTTESTEAKRIKEGRPVKSFTDNPALVGTQNLKIGPEYGGGPSIWKAPPKDPYASRKQAATAKKQAKIPPRPPSNVMYPPGESDFKDREKYSSFVIGKMGFDPNTIDPYGEVEKAQELELPTVFEKTFNGKILWRDKDNLTKEEKDHWNTVHRAFNVHVKDRATDKSKRGKDEYEARMKVFDDKLAEKKAIPALMQTSLESIFLSLDEYGEKTGKVPEGELSNAIRIAEQMVNEGASGYEAIDKATRAVIQKRLAQQGASDALNEIPKMDKGLFSSSPNIKTVKPIVDSARQQGASRGDISRKLKEQGWDDKDIAKLLPKESAGAKPGLEALQQKVLNLRTVNPESYKKFMDYAKQNFTGKKPEEVKVLTEKWLAENNKTGVAIVVEDTTAKKSKTASSKTGTTQDAKMPEPEYAKSMIIGGKLTKEQKTKAWQELFDFADRFGMGPQSAQNFANNLQRVNVGAYNTFVGLWEKAISSQKESIKSLGK